MPVNAFTKWRQHEIITGTGYQNWNYGFCIIDHGWGLNSALSCTKIWVLEVISINY